MTHAYDQIVLPPRAPISAGLIEMMKEPNDDPSGLSSVLGGLVSAVMRLEVEVLELRGDASVRREWEEAIEAQDGGES